MVRNEDAMDQPTKIKAFNTRTMIQLSYLCRCLYQIGPEIRVVISASSYGLMLKTYMYFHHLHEQNDIIMELVRRIMLTVHSVMGVQSEIIKDDFRPNMCTCMLIYFGPVPHLIQSAEWWCIWKVMLNVRSWCVDVNVFFIGLNVYDNVINICGARNGRNCHQRTKSDTLVFLQIGLLRVMLLTNSNFVRHHVFVNLKT